MIRRPVHFIPYRRQEDDVGFSHTFWFSKDSDSESETVTSYIINAFIFHFAELLFKEKIKTANYKEYSHILEYSHL